MGSDHIAHVQPLAVFLFSRVLIRSVHYNSSGFPFFDYDIMFIGHYLDTASDITFGLIQFFD